MIDLAQFEREEAAKIGKSRTRASKKYRAMKLAETTARLRAELKAERQRAAQLANEIIQGYMGAMA